MPRSPKGTWDRRRGVYLAALGDWQEDPRRDPPRRRRAVVLCHEDGTPVARGDDAGRLAAIARLLRRNEAADASREAPTLAELVGRWIAWEAARGARASTDYARRNYGTRLVNVPMGGRGVVLGDLPADQVGVAELMAVRAFFRARGASSGYLRNHEAVLLRCLRWAAEAVEGRDPLVILPRNPFPAGSIRSPSPYRSRRECPTWPELLAILDRLDAWVEGTRRGYGADQRMRARVNALWVRIVGERGCRPVEVAELRVEQWDDAAGGFVLGRHKMSGKTGAVGVIPLRTETARRVRALIGAPGRVGPWVFAPWRSEADGPPEVDRITLWWRRAKGHVGGGRYELYSFRNCVSNALRIAGVEGRAMQLALRHGPEVADTTYRRDTLEEAARVFREAGLD